MTCPESETALCTRTISLKLVGNWSGTSTQNSWLLGQISRPLARSPDFRPILPGLALEGAGVLRDVAGSQTNGLIRRNVRWGKAGCSHVKEQELIVPCLEIGSGGTKIFDFGLIEVLACLPQATTHSSTNPLPVCAVFSFAGNNLAVPSENYLPTGAYLCCNYTQYIWFGWSSGTIARNLLSSVRCLSQTPVANAQTAPR
ncbi:hypothetical protein MGG_15505 [Pyricularia oryzae 70-15]|uniref:Uncharacterized protein n=1 Tax=Pyricularia oryzae (strain 70-15 / ATCC MYA-4617 / FGSC 8958) TaxID=242507 RepID=G4MXY3_PYRO7|nr:uncharacterized protein MGG_15505 [Pyricularia oryzae 70-15]EHA53511.1 hypothetical protein MGG_15505 [Pyricularia oryzae 70-15]